jgi:hypothetical protein
MEGSLVAYKVFTNGSVLNASEINENLMNQSVMVFSNSTARAAALTAPVEGMLTWLEDLNKYQYRNGSGAWVDLGGGGAVLQVLSTAKLDTFTTTSTSYTGITGLTRSITPSSATSKVLVMVQLSFGFPNSANNYGSFRLTGGNAGTYKGATPGSRRDAVFGGHLDGTQLAPAMFSASIVYLDSPATTSAVTYGVECITRTSGVISINTTQKDENNDVFTRGASSITVMEVTA